jgi:uncharacterized membrane protein YfcA
MSGPEYVLYAALFVVTVACSVAWYRAARRSRPNQPFDRYDLLIGFVSMFLDTLGIGSYAIITALCKLRGRPADELIPGTLNVSNAPAMFLSVLLFTVTIDVDPLLLVCMAVSAAAGAWIGAAVVSRMPRRAIQLFMGVALVVAAMFFIFSNLGIGPAPGVARALHGWRFALPVAVNFVLGALMCIGIGNYAPTMALLSVLGMHPMASYPIMMASDGLLIPVASLGFIKSGRFAHGPALGIFIGGIAGTLCAVPLVVKLSHYLPAARWVVSAVILYTGAMMLRSALARVRDQR